MNTLKKRLNMLLMKIMNSLTPSCEVITHKISESLDRKLSLRERLGVRLHVMGCILCERYRRQMLALHTLLQKYATELNGELISDATLNPEARERIKTELHNAARD